MADKVHLPQEAPGPAGETSSGKGAPQFGLTAAMALIVGSIIGVGIVYPAQRRPMTPPGPVPAYR